VLDEVPELCCADRMIGQHKAALQEPDGGWWHRLGHQFALLDTAPGSTR